ncbi:MAG: hypothetical protein ACRD1P_00130 [Thermoanaerobaculia bacterium]
MKGARSPPVFVVTGANRGIGLELARQLALRGDRVIATARDPGATVSPEDSVAGMLRVIGGLSPTDNSRFFDTRGREVPW